MRIRFELLLILIIICGINIGAKAQINFKVGYALDYSTYEKQNLLLDIYNQQNPFLSKSFNPFHFSNGISLGIRYKLELIAFDFSFERITASREAFGVRPPNQSVSFELNQRINRIGAGMEWLGNVMGAGINIHYQQFLMNNGSRDLREVIIRDGDFGNKLYLVFEVPGNELMSLSIQPYAILPWTSSNVFPLSRRLGLDNNFTTYAQENIHFGLSFIFYNGPQ